MSDNVEKRFEPDIYIHKANLHLTSHTIHSCRFSTLSSLYARGPSGAVYFDLSVLPIKMSLAGDVCSLWVQSAAQIKSINLRASDDQH